MNINGNYIKEYQNIIQTTNLQKCYQEFIKFFRYLKIYLEKAMTDYKFTGNIVENNMDYSYFQFSNEELKNKGLKIVVVFVHKSCNYEVWLSGLNREIQVKYYNMLKGNYGKYTLTTNPNGLDYILKNILINNSDYNDIDKLLIQIKSKIVNFITDVKSV